jgi:hypothetical protein
VGDNTKEAVDPELLSLRKELEMIGKEQELQRKEAELCKEETDLLRHEMQARSTANFSPPSYIFRTKFTSYLQNNKILLTF